MPGHIDPALKQIELEQLLGSLIYRLRPAAPGRYPGNFGSGCGGPKIDPMPVVACRKVMLGGGFIGGSDAEHRPSAFIRLSARW